MTTNQLTRDQISTFLERLLMSEHAALKVIPTPERRKDLTAQVDAAILSCMRHLDDPDMYHALGVELAVTATLTICARVSNANGVPAPAPVTRFQELTQDWMRESMKPVERALIQALRQASGKYL